MITILSYNDMIFIHLRRRFKLEFANNTLDSVDTGQDNFLVHFDHLQWPMIIVIVIIIVITNSKNFEHLLCNPDIAAPYQFRQGDATVDAGETEWMFYNL